MGSWHYSLNDVDVQAGDLSEEEEFFSTQVRPQNTFFFMYMFKL